MVPLIGMNTYRTGGLIEWADNEWKLFDKGLSNYFTVISSTVNEFLEKV